MNSGGFLVGLLGKTALRVGGRAKPQGIDT